MFKNTLTDEQLCSLICFSVSAFLNMYQNINSFIIFIVKKNELNELNELESSKTPSQMSSHAHKQVFLYLYAQTCIKTFIHLSHFKSEKQTELNELNELKCSKTLLQMSSYAHIHVFLYLHAQTNLNTLLC